MKNDSELEINQDWSDDQDDSPKRRFMRSGNTGFFRILLVVLLAVPRCVRVEHFTVNFQLCPICLRFNKYEAGSVVYGAAHCNVPVWCIGAPLV